MKIVQKQHLPRSLICAAFLLAGSIVSAQAAAAIPEDPNTFLTFLERYVPEDAVSATAYYDAVDPDGKKTTYAGWLVETGFIESIDDFKSAGEMTLNTDVTSVLHRNETDLGFVRAVSMRCVPDCNRRNPDIYSVIENYANFEDAAARKNRLASVTMEWTAAADGTRPNNKFVVFYAFTGTTDTEPLKHDSRNVDGAPFAPNLDGRGNKAIPGVCNTCHGGTPLSLKNDGSYRRKGNTGSLFLAMDLDNFGFGSDEVPANGPSRADQEAAYKKQNQTVLITHRGAEEFDDVAEIWRVPAGQEIIEGWYGGPGMPGDTFNGEFVPPGWLPPVAPVEAEELYLSSVVPACRACHAQQERALDFATYPGFMEFEDAHKDLVLRIECGLDNGSNTRLNGADDQAVMPLAKLTYEIFWSTSQVEVFKDHLGEVDCGN